jgi:hypothetical protein
MNSSQTTFYTCIESGRLEPEVVLMARTLRACGGRFASAPLLAIQSRHGPAIAATTRRQLDALQVQYVREPRRHPFDWLGFTCKPLAAVIADERAATKHIAWLDGDILVAQEPSALEAPESDAQEVLACVEELGPVSTGPGDRFEPFWAALAEGAGVPVDRIPLVTAGPTGKAIRLHFNSGVFRFRKASGFAQRYLSLFEHLLSKRVVPRDDPSIFLHEQIIFSVAAALWPGGFRALDARYNFHAEPMYESIYPPERYRDAILLHWHGALRMDDFRDTFVGRLSAQLPSVASMVRGSMPLVAPGSPIARLRRGVLRRWRLRLEAAYMRGVTRV